MKKGETATEYGMTKKEIIKYKKPFTEQLEKPHMPGLFEKNKEEFNQLLKMKTPIQKTRLQLIEEYTKDMLETYKMKNSNYGNSFTKTIDEIGLEAGLVPLYNKLHRATSLIKNGNNNFESLDDTLMDLANYALMLRAEIEYRKPKKGE